MSRWQYLIAMSIFAGVTLPMIAVTYNNEQAVKPRQSPYDKRKLAEERLANLLDVTYQQGVIDGSKSCGAKP